MGLERDMELLYEIGTTRHIARTWHQFCGINFANLAEHTLRVMWIALIIAKHEKADCSKVIQLALVHDLPETRTGDVNYLTRMYVDRKEEIAVEDMLAGTSVKGEIDALWREYKAQESLESWIVKDADNLDCDFELTEQASIGTNFLETLRPTREKVFYKLHTETAKHLFKALQSSDPHSWHLGSRNRLTVGDWKA
jgi:putative hydrolase of HD superfamily